MKYVMDLFKPILTLLVTAFSSAFIVSVLWPAGDAFIESWIPAWAFLDPAVTAAREWLGLTEPEAPWWKFWGYASSCKIAACTLSA